MEGQQHSSSYGIASSLMSIYLSGPGGLVWTTCMKNENGSSDEHLEQQQQLLLLAAPGNGNSGDVALSMWKMLYIMSSSSSYLPSYHIFVYVHICWSCCTVYVVIYRFWSRWSSYQSYQSFNVAWWPDRLTSVTWHGRTNDWPDVDRIFMYLSWWLNRIDQAGGIGQMAGPDRWSASMPYNDIVWYLASLNRYEDEDENQCRTYHESDWIVIGVVGRTGGRWCQLVGQGMLSIMAMVVISNIKIDRGRCRDEIVYIYLWQWQWPDDRWWLVSSGYLLYM